MAIKYIYPAWQKAKRDLSMALGLSPSQNKILDAWFRQYCFEYGCATVVSERDLKSDKKEVEYHAVRRNLGSIAESLAENGLVMQSEIKSDHGTRYETRILVFGVSKLGVKGEVRK